METAAALLGPDDPAPVAVINGAARAEVLLICDHASRAVPRSLGTLGLDPALLALHIGWDIGAAAVATHLAELLGAPAIASGFSRLVIDCNRSLDDPTLMPEASDGIAVPGNRGLSADQRAARIAALHEPYHRTIQAHLDAASAGGTAPAIVSIHSFTPRMNGIDRPWHIGILWDRDPRMAVPLIAGLAGPGGLEIGDNQPYSARSPQGYSMARHALGRGLPHVLVEIRQDEIETDAGARRYAGLLDQALRPILADRQLYRTAFYQ